MGTTRRREDQARVSPRGDRTVGIMASLEQRLRGDGGTTARVVWRQDGQRATEKFAVGRNPVLAAKRFQTLVEAAGNRWPEGWVPGQGFVTVETPSDSGHEPTPLLAFGLRYVEQLIIRPGQRARYRAQPKALAVLALPSPTVPGTVPPLRPQRAGRHPRGRPALALTLGSGAQDEVQLPRPAVRRLRLGR